MYAPWLADWLRAFAGQLAEMRGECQTGIPLAAALDPDALGEILHRARQAGGARRDRPMVPVDWAERDERLKAVDVEMAQAVADAVSAAYENAISWDTSCLACAGTLDGAYAETVRREAAEAKLDTLRTRARDVMSGYPLLPIVPAKDILAIIGTEEESHGTRH